MAYFLSIHSLNDELEKVNFLSLIVRMSYFAILGESYPQSHLIIIRECLQNQITHIFTYFNNFHLIPFL